MTLGSGRPGTTFFFSSHWLYGPGQISLLSEAHGFQIKAILCFFTGLSKTGTSMNGSCHQQHGHYYFIPDVSPVFTVARPVCVCMVPTLQFEQCH